MAKETVLVVDDEESMRYFLSRSLGRLGYSVEAVGSGEEALARTREAAPDVVLLDLRLPGMDGIEVLDGLRELAPDAVVVMMTGYGTVERALEAMRRGAADFVTKPFELDDILTKIREARAKASPMIPPREAVSPIDLDSDARSRPTESPQPLTAYLLQAARARGVALPETESGDLPLREAARVFEALYFTELFRRTAGNVSLAARIARISRPSLHRKIQDLGIDVNRFRT